MAEKDKKKDAMAFLGAQAKKEPEKPSKSTTPTVKVRAELAPVLAKLVESKKQKKQAEVIQRQQEEILRPEAAKLRAEVCKATGNFHSTINLSAPDVEPVGFVTMNKYSEIPLSSEEPLQALFGDMMEKSFVKITEISLTDVAMAKIDDILPKLIEAAGGPEKFNEIFGVKQFLKVTDFAHEQQVLDDKMGALMAAAVKQELIRPVTPSFR